MRGEPVSTLTDVYSLGVMLYEMLTRRLPGSNAPEKPSVVAHHSLTLSNAAWSDLDVLCLKAMHNDPAQRYHSVEALIRDIDHYLKGEPLEARPDTLRYRAGKFVKRHRRAVAAAALVHNVTGLDSDRWPTAAEVLDALWRGGAAAMLRGDELGMIRPGALCWGLQNWWSYTGLFRSALAG